MIKKVFKFDQNNYKNDQMLIANKIWLRIIINKNDHNNLMVMIEVGYVKRFKPPPFWNKSLLWKETILGLGVLWAWVDV
jgi:hypothetical protein